MWKTKRKNQNWFFSQLAEFKGLPKSRDEWLPALVKRLFSRKIKGEGKEVKLPLWPY